MAGFSMLILTHHTWLLQLFGVMTTGSMDTFCYYVTYFLSTLFRVAGYVFLLIAVFWLRAQPDVNEAANDTPQLQS
jgi:hypothetical protein